MTGGRTDGLSETERGLGMKMRGMRKTEYGTKRILLLSALAVLLLAGLAVFSRVAAEARWPQSSREGQRVDGIMWLDLSNVKEGYFMAASTKPSKRRLKLRVVKGKETLTYDLNTECVLEVFPFQLGDGRYEISLWENVSGKKYSNAGKMSVNVALTDPNSCFLYPNQYENYTPESPAVAEAERICSGKSGKDVYKAVKDYMADQFNYDYIKAATIQPSTLPDIDGTFEKRRGICQDLAAIAVCMLRTQEVPAKLVIGYADKTYHAWVEVILGEEEVFYDPTADVTNGKPKKYTAERFY